MSALDKAAEVAAFNIDHWRQRATSAEARIRTLEADLRAAEEHADALNEKLRTLSPHGSCACSYDRPGDVCAHHSPALAAEQEARRAAEERAERAEKGLGIALAFLDMAAGEGLAFVEQENGTPAMDAADLCCDIADLYGTDPDGAPYQELVAAGRAHAAARSALAQNTGGENAQP